MEPDSLMNLRSRQISALRQMLRSTSSDSDVQWKVLIFDRIGQDVLSPAMNVKSLREEGVTLHLLINADRDPVPETPAVYFVAPTEENLRLIARDLQQQLYGSYHFNFLSPLSRNLLENLAASAINADVVANVKKVFDRYVNFISLEENMFALRHSSSELSFRAFNAASVDDEAMNAMISSTVDSLFAVFVSLGAVPVIRAPKGNNAAEEVAKRLDKKLRDNLRDARNSLFVNADNLSFHRPLLVLLDRQFDLATPLHHTWTYQALAHDVLQYSLNRVTIPGTTGNQAKARTCEFDANDNFWSVQKGSPFPSVSLR